MYAATISLAIFMDIALESFKINVSFYYPTAGDTVLEIKVQISSGIVQTFIH